MGKAIEGAVLIGAALTGEVLAGIYDPALLFSPMFQHAMESLAIAGVAMEAGAIASALTANRGMAITTRQPAAARQIIYGTQRVGGVLVYQSTTGSNNDQYNFVVVLCGHEVECIENLYLDGRQVYWQGSGAGWTVRNGVGFGGVADGGSHTGPDGRQYNFGGTGHSGLYCEARFGDQAVGDVIGGLTANDPNWAASSAGLPFLGGCTYVYLKLEYNTNLFPKLPEIQFTIRGKNKIWDPRTGTRGFTNNWALVLADVILDPVDGLGDVEAFQEAGSLAQLIAAANVCDEQVPVAATGGTEARYCTDYHYDTSVAPGDAINAMLPGAQGRISMPGGEWYLWPAYWQGPSFSFDANSLRGGETWEPYRSQKDLINRVNGTYIAANYPYNTSGNLYDGNGFFNGETANYYAFGFQTTSAPQYACDPQHGYASDEYLNADSQVLGAWAGGTTYALGDTITYSGVIYRSLIADNLGNQPDTATSAWTPYQNLLPAEMGLRTVLSITQWQRCARIKLKRNRYQGSGEFPMGLAARAMQVTDVMQFTWAALGWTEKYLEVVGCEWSIDFDGDAPKEVTKISIIETGEDVYDWDDTTEELTPYDIPAIPTMQSREPAPPTGLTLTSGAATALVSPTGTVQPRIEVQWTTPADVLTQQIQIQYQLAPPGGTVGPWITSGFADISLNAWYIAGVVAGQQYNVRIRGQRGGAGATSVWVEEDGFTVSLTLSTMGPVGIGLGSLVAEGYAGGTAAIFCSPFTAQVGSVSVAVAPANSPLTGLAQGELYFVYYIDSTFAGGAVTAIATQNEADFLNKVGYFLIDSIVTPIVSSTGGSVFQPTQYGDPGSRSTGNPTGPLQGGSGVATVSGSASYSPSLGGFEADGDWLAFHIPTFVATAAMTLTVPALVLFTHSGTGSGYGGEVIITAMIGSTSTTLADLTAATAQTDYTLAVPIGTDLSTITVEVTATATAASGTGNNVATITAKIGSITVS